MSNPTNRKIDILLIEDNEGDVILTTEGFRAAKVANTVHVCKDGEDGVAFLRREGQFVDAPRPDLVLLDLNLPKMSGHDVLGFIKEDEDLRDIPVVILTSSKAERDLVASYRLYANSYVVKPVGMTELMEVVAATEAFWFQVVTLPKA
jgi:CheY-like chemotaxis protein